MNTTVETFATGVLRGRYRLGALVARGGMGSVFRAVDERLGREVAIKIIPASTANPAEIQSQEDEVNLLAAFNHHALVTLLDAGIEHTALGEPHIYLVMELVDGDDLAHQLESGPIPSRQVAYFGLDIAEALEYIHERGVIHRDIKPANVLIANFGDGGGRPRVKLADFGVAAFGAERQPDPADAPIRAVGTAAYLSPEQAAGTSVGPASDVYSLGLVLLECLTGQLAFPGEPIESAVARLANDPIIPDTLPENWRAVLASMTARNPADRPSVRDLLLTMGQLVSYEIGRRPDPVDPAIIPDDEAARMQAVRRYGILDTPTDGTFDRITGMAARIFSVPVAIVSVVDHDRIWFKSHHGLEIDEISRDAGLCASAILQNEPWIVEDARRDPRALSNPLVAGEVGFQFYAGVPLRTRDGYNLGTLCVLDFTPRRVSGDDLATLEDLAAMVMADLELRLASRRAGSIANV